MRRKLMRGDQVNIGPITLFLDINAMNFPIGRVQGRDGSGT